MRTSLRSRKGSALVESALVLLVYIYLLVGILDVGQLLFIRQSLVDRVHLGVRYASVNEYDVSAIQNVVLYRQPTEPETPMSTLRLTRSMISVARFDPDLTEDRIVVSIVNYPYAFISPLVTRIAQSFSVSATLPYELRQ